MLSKAYVKYIKSLQVKKYRKQEQCFMVEGAKSVLELLTSDFQVVRVLGTAEFLSSLSTPTKTTVEEVTELELSGIGEFQTNTTALAIARMKPNSSLTISSNEFGLVLDDIRDPGNLGTIIRTADWYGIYKIIASSETADFYNPKVISASMGSFTRVQVFYTDLAEYLSRSPQNIFGAYLNGKNIREVTFGTEGLLIIGNESRGISADLEKFVTNKITIPRYGEAESLNAAIATAVICDNLRRSH
jgi:TrmH family RNA methyltransferase